MTRQRSIIRINVASAPQLAWAVLGALHASRAVEIHPMLSTGAEKTIEAEMGLTLDSFEALADVSHHPSDMTAAISSGSFLPPLYLGRGLGPLLKNDPAVPDEDICLDYMADNLAGWDRAIGRGRRFDLGGLRLEILDTTRERHPLALGPTAGRVHLVIEVTDIDQARPLRTAAPAPEAVSWDARLFQIRDPDGVRVTFIQRDDRGRQGP